MAKPRGIFKLTCIPTLLAAPLPKQYNTPTQFPPAAQAKSVVKSTTVKASTLTWFLHRKTTSISLRTTADSGIKQNRKDFISYLISIYSVGSLCENRNYRYSGIPLTCLHKEAEARAQSPYCPCTAGHHHTSPSKFSRI